MALAFKTGRSGWSTPKSPFDEEYIALFNRQHREPAPCFRHISVLFHAVPVLVPAPMEASR